MLEITFDDASKVLKADFEAGRMFWLERTPDLFHPKAEDKEVSCKKWNAKFAGREAFTRVANGYLRGSIFNRSYAAHRVIWLLHAGEWPHHTIDHINGNRLDNRISNLRDVPNVENSRNVGMHCNNTSGHQGVDWASFNGKWRARIKVDYVDHHLGYFDEITDAIAARSAAEAKFGFHENHGRRRA